MSRLIDALLEGAGCLGVELAGGQVEQFALFAAELRKWNSKINLTSIAGDVDIAIKHFVDSIALLKYLGECRTLLDIGSGGGFPAIPLRICSNIAEIYAVDAVEKKINFQRHVARKLKLSGFEALHCRGEDLAGQFAGYFEVVVSRAFADIPKFVRLAKPLLDEGGSIVAMKGKHGGEEAAAAGDELARLGIKVENVEEYRLPLTGDCRSLIIMRRCV